MDFILQQMKSPDIPGRLSCAEEGEVGRDLLRDGFWRPDEERSLLPGLVGEGLLGRNGESAGLADASDGVLVVRPELFRYPPCSYRPPTFGRPSIARAVQRRAASGWIPPSGAVVLRPGDEGDLVRSYDVFES